MSDRVTAALLTVGWRSLRWRAGVSLVAEYQLTAWDNPASAVMIDPKLGEVEEVGVSKGFSVDRTIHNALAGIEICRNDAMSWDRAVVSLRVTWGKKAIAKLGGSPICVLPSHLPRFISELEAHAEIEQSSEQGNTTALCRLIVHPPVPAIAGRILDVAGEILMVALPTRRRFAEQTWHADDAVVLAGEGFATVSARHRSAFRDRVVEVHQFLADEFGRGQNVRALLVCERGASDYWNGFGQMVCLEDTWLEGDQRWFIAERVIVRQIASMWWHYGVRIGGADQEELGEGFAIYAVMRWFKAMGKDEELVLELERARDARLQRAGRLARALFLRDGPELREMLRELCASSWGYAVSVPFLRSRLATVGVELPF